MNDSMVGGALLSCRNIGKTYLQGKTPVEVLQGIDLDIAAGETLAIVGASGSGKSTLLNILGTLDQPSAGTLSLQQQDVATLNDRQKAALRNRSIGFVYQFHHLLPEFTALENVAMPLLLRKMPVAEAARMAEDELRSVGLQHRLTHKPGQLSGGERQRVAIARALVTNPALVFMDEPTGNLDSVSAANVQSLLWTLVEERKTAFVLVTHDLALAGKMQRQYRLENGQLRAI
ncbi:MAG: ATP-binding cassette domain-containing protein [Hahellaceae bacterium]|nr:ATP-binding cassette domain-containing protein [Hahellaceae bacterium]